MEDDVFNILNRTFLKSNNHTNIIDYNSLEKMETDDEYIYTFPIKKDVTKDDINIEAKQTYVDYNILGENYTIIPLEPIIPELTQVTLKNNILDIVLHKDKNWELREDIVKVVIHD